MANKREAIPWRNRIVNTGTRPAGEFLANVKNWRIHPKAQRAALTGVLAEVGWVTGVVVNKTSGAIIDGHARIEEALKMGDDTPVPFIEVELTEEEEVKILATFDPISAMAAADKAQLDALLHDVSTADEGIQAMLAELAADNGLVYGEEVAASPAAGPWRDDELPSNAIGGSESPYQLKERVNFKSSNKYGIPDLLPDFMGDIQDDTIVWCGNRITPKSAHYFSIYKWTSVSGLDPASAILSFYTHDFAFEDVWDMSADTTERFLATGWAALVTPNFSLLPSMPFAEQLWQTFRARWVARYWQAVGIKIIPDVDWNDDSTFEFCTMGVPIGLPCVSIQVQTKVIGGDQNKRDDGIASICDTLQPRSLLVYGAKPDYRARVNDIAKRRCVFVDSAADSARGYRKGLSK